MDRKRVSVAILRKAGLTRANVDRFYDGLNNYIQDCLKNDGEAVLPGIGTFRVRTRKARNGVNPRTGEKIRIKRQRVIRFRPYKELKDAVRADAIKKEAPGDTVTELKEEPAGEEPKGEDTPEST